MNFFERQDQAFRRTRLLVFLFAAATLCIVAAVTVIVAFIAFSSDPPRGAEPRLSGRWLADHAELLVIAALGTLAFISLGSLGKMASLRAGGGSVARSLGGTRVSPEDRDLGRRRLMNVVEEMAIASGVPVPEVYILEEEPGINAFAAGFGTGDAAVAVTRGAMERLDRAELQGVMAHEFSHILNGDMRLNMRLIGVLHGILLIALTAQIILRSAAWGGAFRRRSKEGAGMTAAIIALAVSLMIVGYIGLFFGRIIQAAVSRQRELLADAAGVQFTRDPQGLAGALKKIGGFTEGSRLRAVHAEEVRHMLFGASGGGFSSLFATHPPLEERIRVLDPSFDPSEYRRVAEAIPAGAAAGSAAFAGGGAGSRGAADPGEAGRGPVEPLPPRAFSLSPEEAVRAAGTADTAHVSYAAAFLRNLPEHLREAAAAPESAARLVLALLLGADPETRSRQTAELRAREGAEAAEAVLQLDGEIRPLGVEARLPLLDLCFPAVRRLGPARTAAFAEVVELLSAADGRYDLFEFMLARVLRARLAEAERPGAGSGRPSLDARLEEAALLLAVTALLGEPDDGRRSEALAAGFRVLGRAPRTAPDASAIRFSDLDRALERLEGLSGGDRERLLRALVATAAHDGRITLEEAEMVRAAAAALRTPLPPLHAGRVSPAGSGRI